MRLDTHCTIRDDDGSEWTGVFREAVADGLFMLLDSGETTTVRYDQVADLEEHGAATVVGDVVIAITNHREIS
jgi:hypothetical protein